MIYKVKWEIDIEADSPIEAAKEALKIQQDIDSWALVFDVHNGEEPNEPFIKQIDLNEED